MFRREGSNRTDRDNRLLAGYLACIAGLVNSSGFILIGAFTSHTTGNIGRLANDIAQGNAVSAVSAALLLITFFLGAFVASLVIEANRWHRLPYTYAALLFVEAALLGGFLASSRMFAGIRAWDVSAGVLCAAMGLQNSLITRLSGATVRTTHLTGVVTDLGIEAARWFRYWRSAVVHGLGLAGDTLSPPPGRPSLAKPALLSTIVGMFVIGSVAGAMLSLHVGRLSMLLPMTICVLGAGYALYNGKTMVAPPDALRP